VLTEALFSPSDFLAVTSYTADLVTDTPYITAEPSNHPKFSEYLAALEEQTAAGNVPPVRDEAPAAVEDSYETEEEEALIAAESAAAENRLAALKAGGAAHNLNVVAADEAAVDLSVSTGTESGGAVSDILTKDDAGKASLAEAAARTDGKDASARQADMEKNDAAAKLKALPSGGQEKTENTAGDEGVPRQLNSGEGIQIDQKTPEIDEQLAADLEDSAGTTPKAETLVDTNVDIKTSAAENSRDAAELTVNTSGVLARAAAPEERNGGASGGGEKKSPAERARRHTAVERIEGGGAAQQTAGQGAETQEPKRVSAIPEAEITVNLRGESRGAAAGERGTLSGAKPSASFETFLARELQQNLNGDIVRQAQVLLREGGEGTIRLSLKPESLGKVKIHLEMAENKITGKIVVESGEALRAFEHEMDALKQTFCSEGFDGASLNLELAEHEGPQGNEGGWRPGGERVSTETASSRYDENAGGSVYFGAFYSAKQINVLV
jgi:flagellar hook-length control protein FliK